MEAARQKLVLPESIKPSHHHSFPTSPLIYLHHHHRRGMLTEWTLWQAFCSEISDMVSLLLEKVRHIPDILMSQGSDGEFVEIFSKYLILFSEIKLTFDVINNQDTTLYHTVRISSHSNSQPFVVSWSFLKAIHSYITVNSEWCRSESAEFPSLSCVNNCWPTWEGK